MGTLKANSAMQALKPILRPAYFSAVRVTALVSRLRTPFALRKYDKLHLGSGPHRKPGWANIDISGLHNIIWDLRRPLPVKAGIVRFIYSEHFIEHVDRPDALRLLSACRNLLAPGGVLRISTPNLRRSVEDYLASRTPRLPGIAWYPETPCRALNETMRCWGHRFVYDETELVNLLHEAGFQQLVRVSWGESEHQELKGLETRPFYDDLIFEAR